MDFLSFNPSLLEEQAAQIIESGTYVSTTAFEGIDIMLYRFNNEFVEIWYNTQNKRLLKVENLSDKAINPFLKHLSGYCLN